MEVNGLSEFLEAQGISWMQRKLAMNCNPVDTIKVDGQKLTISYTGIFTFISRLSEFKFLLIGVPSWAKSESEPIFCSRNMGFKLLLFYGSSVKNLHYHLLRP